MKYIVSFIFLLSLLPFLSVEVRSDDLHPTLQERKVDNAEVRNAMPTLEPVNPTIQGGEARNPRDEQTPRDRQAVLCDPKFGGDPGDPGCNKPTPTSPPSTTPPSTTPPQGGPGNPPGTSPDNSTTTTTTTPPIGGGSSTEGIVLGLPKTSSSALPLTSFLGIICLVKGLSLTIKSLKI